MYDGVELRGYAMRLVIPLVLVVMVPPMLVALFLTGSDSNGDRRFAVLVALLFAIPAVAAGSFKLRLQFDPAGQALWVTRRFWFGASRQWRLPLAEFERWYYVKETQTLVLRRGGLKPLRFILFMGGGGPERLVAWGEAVLPGYSDAQAGSEASKRAKRALILGFGLGFPLLTAAAVTVLLMIYGT